MADSQETMPVPPPTTDEGKKEAENMRRAKALGQQIWDASRGLLALLGASAPLTFALSSRSEGPDQAPVWLLGGAVACLVFGAFAYYLEQSVTASRTRRADIVATRWKGPYTFLAFLLVVQLLVLPLSALLQGLAVYQTLLGSDATSSLNSELSDRIVLYAASPEALYLVSEYCSDHVSDNAASTEFLRACVRFNQEPALTPDEAKDIASKLR